MVLRHGTPLLPRVAIASTVYDYLFGLGKETPGYGLYTYVLFPAKSTRAERFLTAAFDTTLHAGGSSLSPDSLNLLYLPTRSDRAAQVLSMRKPVSAKRFAHEWYDYALSQRILGTACKTPAQSTLSVCAGDLSRGPYLFTYSRPASALSSMPPPYLLADLSQVHERAFGEFVAAYKAQLKRSDYTDSQRIETFRLGLLNIVLTAADWIRPARNSLTDILHMASATGQIKDGGN